MIATGYKTIVVHQDSLARSAARLEIAVELAESMGAHLIGVHPAEAVTLPNYVAVELGQNAPDAMRQRAADREREAAARFADRLGRSHGLTFQWVASEDTSADAIVRHARYADLTILGQADPEEVPVGQPANFVETAILEPGGPSLVVPYTGTYTVTGGVALVAWNRSRESARALKDALPLLKLAREVVVITARTAPAPEIPELPSGTQVAHFLARHGVRAEAVEHRAVDIDRGEWLLSRTVDLGAGLVVMGAYGHSRLRELILGGVTRTFLKSMTIPVLLSH